jgi:hypothetical protein
MGRKIIQCPADDSGRALEDANGNKHHISNSADAGTCYNKGAASLKTVKLVCAGNNYKESCYD